MSNWCKCYWIVDFFCYRTERLHGTPVTNTLVGSHLNGSIRNTQCADMVCLSRLKAHEPTRAHVVVSGTVIEKI